ncbi:putative pentatricopeptide repeat-containing protein At3g23330 isoform X3 [Telopea speciosissima]|uniref:putative pentatricopeptide repeat-containing protein At3g23330 isoform X2 n=1 Tax=Telopea speciosissima TaxID=54955 RepID=UPI001CC7D199|nr:putative pentatricopeptide repeat-containing protein At3g23330 isoform X2 [Telopea speciosissima]XP_043704824.1 putative pentatricopeptide repeat-containing protein At3g23330 isoform X3 [Telopea speciosissima]
MSRRIHLSNWVDKINTLVRRGQSRDGLLLFYKLHKSGDWITGYLLSAVLKCCTELEVAEEGKQAHCAILKHGFHQDVVLMTSLVGMYSKCISIEEARRVFHEMPETDVVATNSLITGLCRHHLTSDAVQLFESMSERDVGSWNCFDNMPAKNVVSWTSLMVGYGKHGLGLEALKAFDRMEMEGILPNKVTFLGILFACSHAGLVREGWRSFNTMVCKYTIQPMMEHYTCVVDLFARAGHLKEANDFIERMPIEPDAKLLTAFLRSCFSFMNVELTKRIGQRVLELKPEAGAYMLLSNFYGVIGDLDGIVKVRKLMMDRGVRKEKAYTWIEINRRVHAFESGDRSHPLHEEISNYMKNLIAKLKIYGYVPNTNMVVQNLDEHKKEEILLGHSEKLAIGLGLISTPAGTRITIVKNLRVCNDCHDLTKLISRIEEREIVARDSSRFHHFKQGECSCGNHW